MGRHNQVKWANPIQNLQSRCPVAPVEARAGKALPVAMARLQVEEVEASMGR